MLIICMLFAKAWNDREYMQYLHLYNIVIVENIPARINAFCLFYRKMFEYFPCSFYSSNVAIALYAWFSHVPYFLSRQAPRILYPTMLHNMRVKCLFRNYDSLVWQPAFAYHIPIAIPVCKYRKSNIWNDAMHSDHLSIASIQSRVVHSHPKINIFFLLENKWNTVSTGCFAIFI